MSLTLDEYRRRDGIGLRELIAAGEVTAAEIEAVAREALGVANAAVNGLGGAAVRPGPRRPTRTGRWPGSRS